MDTVSKAARSRIMAKVRSKGNVSTELRLAKILRSQGLKGWRRNSRLLGKPDFVYPKLKLAIFVDGCFWHGCPDCCRVPAQNRKYWLTKIKRNKDRDKRITKELKNMKWTVMRIWEHELTSSQVIKKLNIINSFR